MKNKLRPQDIKYEPVESPKRPIWMYTSVEGPESRINTSNAVGAVLIILAVGVIVITAMAMKGGV